MRYFVKENTWLQRNMYPLDHGWGNGYVLLDKEHPYYGKEYDDINDHVDVHCGLTFSVKVDEEMVKSWELEEGDFGKWCVGFDTAHLHDTLEKWPKEAVEEETKRLFDQLAQIETVPIS